MVLLKVEDLTKYFPVSEREFFSKKRIVRAVDGVTFDISRGETLGLIGESGCGKTTLGRLVLRLIEPTKGKVCFMGNDIFSLKNVELRRLRPKMQMIFQDPSAAMNPRKTISETIAQPLVVNRFCEKKEIENRMLELLGLVDLTPPESFLNKYPHEISGGQMQRVAIARAIALNPDFVVADEPVSSLDVSVRGKILNLLLKLQSKLQLAYLFISHELNVVRSFSGRVAVMYLGEIVEMADKNELFSNPLHPYTQALLEATPIPDPVGSRNKAPILLRDDIPSPLNIPQGCRFHPRCTNFEEGRGRICGTLDPTIVEVKKGHFVRCHCV